MPPILMLYLLSFDWQKSFVDAPQLYQTEELDQRQAGVSEEIALKRRRRQVKFC